MKSSACTISDISADAADALRAADVRKDRVILCGQLAKPVYAEVNEALSRLGGRWSGRDGAHLFDLPVGDRLDAFLDGDGVLPAVNPAAFFPTPDRLAAEVVAGSRSIPGLPAGARVLEPSVGHGALVRALRSARPDVVVDACEIDEVNRAAAAAHGVRWVGSDFLELAEDVRYDLVIANPPFAVADDKLAWVTHVEKMLRLLKEGGALIAIVPTQILFRSTKRILAIRDRVLTSGRIVENPADAFAESGTGAKTATIFFGPCEGHAATIPAGRDAAVAPRLPPDVTNPEGPEPSAENVYWKDVTGDVFDKGHLWVNGSGAVIYWMGQEAGAAEGRLARMADETKARVAAGTAPRTRSKRAA